MRTFIYLILMFLAVNTLAQSGRVPTSDGQSPSVGDERPVKEMFEEANSYLRLKASEFDSKKIPFSDRLFLQTKIEQRQLAAKYAASAGGRKDHATDDIYYVGMLHWIAENLDGTYENLTRFIAQSPDTPRKQTARSVVVVVLAKQKKLDEAETVLAEYMKAQPTKATELSRMSGEMAKAYQVQKDFGRMAPHAEAGYEAAKALLKDASSRARGLDEILDAAMLVFEAYRDAGKQQKADQALDEMRRTAAEIESNSFYYYAVDQRIRYMIETGRKAAAIDHYLSALINAGKDFRVKTAGADVVARLKKREKHYKLLGAPAPELMSIDQWFPGTARSLASYRGKVVLLDFWATWCTPCFEAFPALTEWHTEFAGDGFEILGLTRFYGEIGGTPANVATEIAYLKQFREKERLPYDFVVAKDQGNQLLYGATALPTAVLIDRKGIVRYIETGTSSARIGQMREMLLKLIAEK